MSAIDVQYSWKENSLLNFFFIPKLKSTVQTETNQACQTEC